MKDITWLLIADASRARLYAFHKAKFLQVPQSDALNLLQTFTHDESRKMSSDLSADKSGEFGRGTFIENSTPKAHEAEVFAHESAKTLQAGLDSDCFRDVILVAPAHFIGMLQHLFSKHLKQKINQTIEKDYTQLDKQDLAKQLLQHF